MEATAHTRAAIAADIHSRYILPFYFTCINDLSVSDLLSVRDLITAGTVAGTVAVAVIFAVVELIRHTTIAKGMPPAETPIIVETLQI
jgi:hypothetical protein